ncbi:MCE family protein [Conexibacter sp. W3-3-2]|uniref:MlaD family protein n=1 Tax=Conexibacter sp. W3-3-2 TaxID=2675227 RepID=UPI0012B9A543|nr:MlaD family protein [Conexibacter sp. W3-3-2]MTD43724.1 MCE family protein [Conexibacter sp. W3-3-2]
MTRVTVIAGLLLAALGTTMVTGCGSSEETYTLRLRVDDAAGLLKDQDVKIDGVRAGKITAVELDRGDKVQVDMELDEGASPVGKDATARIRSVSVLGEKYVDLTPGNADDPAAPGSWVTPSKNVTPVELDDVLDTLDAGTRARLKLILAEGGVALTGRADEVRSFLELLPQGMDEVGALLDQATADNASLRQVVDAGDSVIGTLARERRELGELIGEASAAFSTTADRRAALGQAVGETPSTLAQMRKSLALLETAAAGLEPAADRIRTSAAPIEAALKALPGFAKDGVPALRAARAAAPDLDRLARETRPTVKRLAPVAAQLSETLTAVDPLVQDLDKGLMDDALYFLQTWARVTQRADGLGHLFGAQITITEDTVRQIVDRVVSEGQANAKRKPAKAATPVPRVPPALARPKAPPVKRPAEVVPAVKDLVCTAVDGVTDVVGGVVGGLLGGAKLPGRDKSACPKSAAEQEQAKPPSAKLGGLLGTSSKDGTAPSSTVDALVDYLFGS